MIYLATPYSHPDVSVRQHRFEMACMAAGLLIKKGEVVFSPVAQTHPIAVLCNLPTDFDFWDKFDREFIKFATKVIVVVLEGWETSKGVSGEVKIAQELGIPIEYKEINDL